MTADSVPKTLLLVEDEAIIGMAETIALSKEGYTVIHVLSGEEAIAAMAGELGPKVDLILMDIDLREGIDGPRAAMEILRRRDVPVVFLSSHTEKAIVAETEEITNYGYILKNSGDTVLFASIRMAFKLHQAHALIEQSEERFRDLIENTHEGVCIMDADDRFVFANAAAHEAFGLQAGNLEGRSLAEFIDERNAEITVRQTAIRRRGEKSEFEQEIIRPDGTRRKIRVRASPQYDHERRFAGSFVVLYDITEEEREHERLRRSEARYRSLFEDSSNAILEEDLSELRPHLDGLAKAVGPGLDAYFAERPDELVRCTELIKIVRANREYLRMVGAASEGDLPATLEPYINRSPDSMLGLREEIMAIFEGRLPFERDFSNELLSREMKWIRLRMSIVPGHEADWSRVLLSIMDVTEQKEAERALEKAVGEKDFLMRELQHRVKNNLTLVSSLLSLDSERSEGLDARQVLMDAQMRIQSIALIYDFLSRSGGVERLGSGDYAKDLVRLLSANYEDGGRDIRVSTAIEDFDLDIKACVPIGLIINELLSNALKYAFPSGRGGEIAVELRRVEGAILLRVRDDGVGLPAGFDWKAGKSLGLQLVSMLSSQLGGTVAVESREGLSVTVSIPEARP